MTQYIWFPISSGSIDIDSPISQEKIYDDMMRFAVASVWGNKQTVIDGKPLGEVIRLDTIIRSFTKDKSLIDNNYQENVEQAKTVFLEQLTKLKESNLKEALKKMEYNRENLGDFDDIDLDEKGAALDEFKMKPSKITGKEVKMMAEKYEQSLEEFKQPDHNLTISNFNVSQEGAAQQLSFDFKLEYNELPEDNEDEIKDLDFGNFKYKEAFDIDWDIEGRGSISPFSLMDKLTKTSQLNKRKERELKNDILEIIYNNLRTENKLKSGILSPRYVTPFTIEGNYEGATFTKTGKKFKTSDEEYTGKGVLKYKGKGNTTHELHISEGFIPRGWLQTPSHTDQPSTLTHQASKNIIKTYREDLIEEIQGNLKRLGRAIRSLS